MFDGLIGNRVEMTVAKVQGLGLGSIEGTSAAAAKDGKLVAGFVYGPVAVDAFRNGQCWPASVHRSDEFWSGARAEAGEMAGVVPGRNDLQDAEAVLAVGDEGESAGGDHADFHVVHVVELAFGREQLLELWRLGLLNVEDGESLLPRRDVRIGSGDVHVAGVLKRNDGVGNGLGPREIRHIENFESVAIGDERIAELDGNPARVAESRRADGGGDARGERIIEIHDDERPVRKDV